LITKHSRVFQDSLHLIRPYDDALVSRARCEPLAIFGIADAVDGVFVTLQWLDESAIIGVIHKHTVASSNNELGAIWTEAQIPHAGTEQCIT